MVKKFTCSMCNKEFYHTYWKKHVADGRKCNGANALIDGRVHKVKFRNAKPLNLAHKKGEKADETTEEPQKLENHQESILNDP